MHCNPTRHQGRPSRLKTRSRAGKLLAAGAATLAAMGPAPIASADVFANIDGGGFAHLDIESIKERKFARVIRQQYDFSCGSAAVATLLTYHYDRNTTEANAFTAMWKVGNQKRIQEVGFSLLEMKNYLGAIGYRADGFKLSLDRMQEIGVPGIALIDVKGYKHFVVVKGVTDRTVLIGDPSKGLITKSTEEFEEVWDGVILFIRSKVSIGKENFNAVRDWKRAPSGPFDRALDLEPLAENSLSRNVTFNAGISVPMLITPILDTPPVGMP